jgi:hypothetical protein
MGRFPMAYLKLVVLIGFIVRAKLAFSLLFDLLLLDDDSMLRRGFLKLSFCSFAVFISREDLLELLLAALPEKDILSLFW